MIFQALLVFCLLIFQNEEREVECCVNAPVQSMNLVKFLNSFVGVGYSIRRLRNLNTNKGVKTKGTVMPRNEASQSIQHFKN